MAFNYGFPIPLIDGQYLFQERICDQNLKNLLSSVGASDAVFYFHSGFAPANIKIMGWFWSTMSKFIWITHCNRFATFCD